MGNKTSADCFWKTSSICGVDAIPFPDVMRWNEPIERQYTLCIYIYQEKENSWLLLTALSVFLQSVRVAYTWCDRELSESIYKGTAISGAELWAPLSTRQWIGKFAIPRQKNGNMNLKSSLEIREISNYLFLVRKEVNIGIIPTQKIFSEYSVGMLKLIFCFWHLLLRFSFFSFLNSIRDGIRLFFGSIKISIWKK